MFVISRDEAMLVRKNFPDVAVYKTMVQKKAKQHTYYTEERRDVQRFIDMYRKSMITEHFE